MGNVENIVKELEAWSDAYYAGNTIVSDEVFDAKEEELRKLDPANAWFKKNREKASGYGVKFPHIYKFIGSIDKIHSVEESKVLALNYSVVISAKLDGTSLVAYFEKGQLVRALTRGDGHYGLDITDKFLAITKKYSVTIPADFTGALRGEVIFSNQNWQRFKAMHPEAKAPRNSGTGLVNGKEVSPELELLDWVTYDVVAMNQNVDKTLWQFLETFGYPLASHSFIDSKTAVTHELLQSMYDEWSALYPMDGLVIRAEAGKTKPEFLDSVLDKISSYVNMQEAYKFQAEIKIVEVQDIVWQMGRTGKFTPVVIIPPTELSGAIVQNVSAHNAGNVKELGIGIGAEIAVCRSGEVIPYLHEVIKPAATSIPTHCPFCGAELKWTATNVDVMCDNAACPELRKLAVIKYIESICRDIKGLGDVFLSNFIEELGATNILTLLKATKSWGSKNFEKLGNADNIVAAKVLKKLSVDLINPEHFLVGLGVSLLGETFSKELAQDTPALKKIFNNIIAWEFTNEPHGTSSFDFAVYDSVIEKLPGRVALANNILDATPEIKEILLYIQSVGGSFAYQAETASLQPAQYYAISGSLSKSRKEIEAEFAADGWQMTDNINKAQLLINNDSQSNSSKNVKARAAGKPILTEAEFRAKYL